ncbi:MAG: SHOCT domain-containing protein [Bacteroidales bacterium]|jgi:uncharacterized membrane protein|nr:SHOCT domain-containing protein [Bacteroidales bacterium]
MVRIVYLVLIFIVIFLLIFFITKAIIETKKSDSDFDLDQKSSIADELLKLKALKERGVITEEEFEKLKNKLLKKL